MPKEVVSARDMLVARDPYIDIRYEPMTDRAFIVDTDSGEMIVVRGALIVDAADTIEVLRKSAL